MTKTIQNTEQKNISCKGKNITSFNCIK